MGEGKIIGIILARGGSKGLPKKNIKKLLGKPLIAYTIEAAKKAKKLDGVFVSTEDPEIKRVAKKYGAEVIDRPPELAKDNSPSYEALQHAVNCIEKKTGNSIGIVVTLQATSPVRDAADIDNAIKKLVDTEADAVVGVCGVDYPPFWMKTIEEGRIKDFLKTEKIYYTRQEMPKVYRLNGSIYVTKRDVLFEKNSTIGDNTRAYLMDDYKSIDIDREIDFLTAEAVIKKLKAKKEK